jgi:MFS family permease
MWGLMVYGGSLLLLSFVNSLWQLYLLYGVLMGIAWSACSNVSLSTLLSTWFHRRRGLAISIGYSGLPMGQFLLTPLSMILILNQGYQLAIVFLSFLLLAIALPLVWRLVRDNPEEMNLLPDGRTSELHAAPAPPDLVEVTSDSAVSQNGGLRHAVRTLPFWLLVGSFFICGITAHLLIVHFVPAAIMSGYNPLTAAKAAGVMGASAVGGIWITGFLSDKVGRKIPLAILYLFRGLGFIMFLFATTEPMLYLSAFLIGFGTFGTGALTAGLVADIFGVKSMGTILGIVSMGHQIGGGFSTYIAGYIANNNGTYYWAFLPAAFLLFIAFLAAVFIREKTV